MKVLILEQTSELAELMGLYISSLSSAEVTSTDRLSDAQTELKREGCDVVILNQCFTAAGRDSFFLECKKLLPSISLVVVGEGPLPSGAAYLVHPGHLVQELKEMMKTPFWKSHSGKPTEVPIPLTPYLVYRLGVCPADLFLKLGESNWVKLFNRGAPFGEEDRIKFEQKGLKEFYILSDDIHRAIDYFGDLLSSLKASSLIEDAPLVADAGEFIWHSLKENGFREEFQKLASEAIKGSLLLIRKEPELKKFVEKIFRPEHAWMVRHNLIIAHLACAFASRMGWNSEQTYQKIATAALLHDMALPRLDQDEEVWLMDVGGEKMSENLEQEMKSFLQHPIEGSEMVRRHKSIAPDTDKIILEHHELPDGLGFPRGLSAHQISPLGAVFIFSHAIATILIHEKDTRKWSMALLKDRLSQERWMNGHFKKAWQALEMTNLFAESSGR